VDAQRPRREVRARRAIDAVDVGQRDGGVAQRVRALDDVLRRRGAVEEREVRATVELGIAGSW
jgi:hypothetical protein